MLGEEQFFCEFKTKKLRRVYRRNLSVRFENVCLQINDETSFEMIEWVHRLFGKSAAAMGELEAVRYSSR